MARLTALPVALLALLVATGCPPTKTARRYDKHQATEALKTLDKAGLVIGEFPLADDAVLDGDTIAIRGLDSTMRLLGMDTEETFKRDSERKAYAKGFEAYKKELRGNSSRPVKMATPLGEEAKAWAKQFFKGVRTVRLERDHPGEIRGFFGRYLAYVFAEKNGVWVNYNVEAVRAGMSPYYAKYGHSRRFKTEFLEAEAEARAKRLGIWDPTKEHYDDYDERLKWWNARGDIIDRFEREAEKRPNYIVLTRWDALRELEKREGQEVVVLAAVGEIKLGDKGPSLVKLARNQHSSFTLVFFDKDVFKASGVAGASREFIAARGIVKKYKSRRGDESLQFVISLPGQISLDGTGPRAVPLVKPPPAPVRQAEIPVVSADPGYDPLQDRVPEGPEDPRKTPLPAERPSSPGANEPDPDEIPADLNFDDLSELPLEPE